MLIALAMMAQDVPLNAQATEALQCGRTVIATLPTADSQRATGMFQAIYFMMSAAAAHPVQGKLFLERAGDLGPQIFDGSSPPTGERDAILKRCDARYPMARGAAAVKLPGDPFQRDLLCVGASSYVMGIFQGAQLADLAKPYERLQTAYLERVPDSVFAEHGLTGEDSVKEAMDTSLRNSLRIGNLDGITKACEQALKAK